MDALSSGGLHQTGKDAVGFQSAIRSGPEVYLAEDHQVPERLKKGSMNLGNPYWSPPLRE